MSLAVLRKMPGRLSTNRTARSMSRWSVSGSYQVVGLAGRPFGHGLSVMALIVCTATPRWAHSLSRASASRAYASPASCVALYWEQHAVEGKAFETFAVSPRHLESVAGHADEPSEPGIARLDGRAESAVLSHRDVPLFLVDEIVQLNEIDVVDLKPT
jgi:hypothetical protein